MDTKNRELISAYCDGDLPEHDTDMALDVLRADAGKAAWAEYHHVGDLLRSDELAIEMSSDFMTRFAARLENEPVIVAPVISSVATQKKKASSRRFLLPGAAASATLAVFAWLGGPQLMVASKAPAKEEVRQIAVTEEAGMTDSSAKAVVEPQAEVLRDPDIDQYLIAHQRFSPSVYSTAQYARSANFTTSFDK
ncbi:MAG: histidine kinase [Paucimonas sp.]|nr:histidine kinase [Paucimonas sp.]